MGALVPLPRWFAACLELATARGIVTRTLLGWLEQRALAAAAEGSAHLRSSDSKSAAHREPEFAARSGAAVFARRLGSARNLDLHFHALVLDGAFVSSSGRLAPSLQPNAQLDVISVGSTWNFQDWYRDPSGPISSGFDFSDAVEIEFCP